MRRCLEPGTPLLLFNVESRRLFGPFVATDFPDTCLESNAFAGNPNAQVPIALPDDADVFNEIDLPHKIVCGEKPAIQMMALRRQLKQEGRPLGADVQHIWDEADGSRAESNRPRPPTTQPPPWRLAPAKAARGHIPPKRARELSASYSKVIAPKRMPRKKGLTAPTRLTPVKPFVSKLHKNNLPREKTLSLRITRWSH